MDVFYNNVYSLGKYWFRIVNYPNDLTEYSIYRKDNQAATIFSITSKENVDVIQTNCICGEPIIRTFQKHNTLDCQNEVINPYFNIVCPVCFHVIRNRSDLDGFYPILDPYLEKKKHEIYIKLGWE